MPRAARRGVHEQAVLAGSNLWREDSEISENPRPGGGKSPEPGRVGDSSCVLVNDVIKCTPVVLASN